MISPKALYPDGRGKGNIICCRKRPMSLTIPKEFLLDGNKVMNQMMVLSNVIYWPAKFG